MSENMDEIPTPNDTNLPKEPIAPKFVCPFHGLVVAIPTKIKKGDEMIDGFTCAVKTCDVTRLQSELEFP